MGKSFDGSSTSLKSRNQLCWKWKMLSFVFYLWFLLTTMVATICAFSMLQPFWIVHPDNIHSFGLHLYCRAMSGAYSDGQYLKRTCLPYGSHFRLSNIPSGAWQASWLLFNSGCGIMAISIILGTIGVCIKSSMEKRIGRLTTYLQTTAVIVMTSGLLAFPLGLDTHFFRYYCGESADVYNAAQCSMGWSYMLATMGTALSIFCPILWNFRDVKNESLSLGEYV